MEAAGAGLVALGAVVLAVVVAAVVGGTVPLTDVAAASVFAFAIAFAFAFAFVDKGPDAAGSFPVGPDALTGAA